MARNADNHVAVYYLGYGLYQYGRMGLQSEICFRALRLQPTHRGGTFLYLYPLLMRISV